MSKKAPRILVMSVPSWNSRVGANTWESLLKQYDRENIASIYIRDDISDSEVCSRYFCISENRIIKSLLNRKIKTGYEVERQDTRGEEDLEKHNQLYQKMSRKRSHLMLLAREIIWKLGKWKTDELNEFIDSFKPDIILHSMDGYIHLNRITQYAIRRSGAKAIGYIWDDNFTYKVEKGIGFKIYRFFQRISLKKLAKKTQVFFAITEKTKREADEFFGVDCTVLTKPLNSDPEVRYDEITKPFKMLYTGNLYIGRDNSLAKISSVLKEINKDETKIVLDVYTNTMLDDDKKAEIENDWCVLHPPVPQKEVLELQKNADILLFLEDIDGKYASAARLSFSTKLTDYLSAGKCIFAVGNKDTAPMQYLKENDRALTADNPELICSVLQSIDSEILKQYAQNAVKCGKENHNQEKICRIFNEVINDTDSK